MEESRKFLNGKADIKPFTFWVGESVRPWVEVVSAFLDPMPREDKNRKREEACFCFQSCNWYVGESREFLNGKTDIKPFTFLDGRERPSMCRSGQCLFGSHAV
ncbi:hypothetical protein CN354_03815 [Bacillus cereus]|nr:hypothetical protein CN354_03815 [Bacillus cereus]